MNTAQKQFSLSRGASKKQIPISFLSALIATALVAFAAVLPAQNNSADAPAPTAAALKVNPAIVPVSRTGGSTNRQSLVLQRAKDNQGACDVAFIGDSITQGWENAGKNVWQKYYGSRKCLDFGVGGDRTQHVLWRFEQGQLDGVKPKAVVLMIGTNNSNGNDNTEGEILEGVQAIVEQLRARLPETKILLVAIFPRGQTFSAQRGKILQVNQALAKLDDGKNVFFVDFGSQLIEADGSISKTVMPDHLHLSERGYEIWAEAIEPKLKEILGK
ncbi:MAG: platelet-activating factor acetylhydrolase IB subunit [Verrucomicrobia bacterium]|jgi:beta-glucosidase|nr:platelet-activating factor acetylhydrolase IB subunit [Verrucomicrobiota bacterium]